MKNTISLEEYLQDSCKLSSLPFWKVKGLDIPANIRVIHDDEFTDELLPNETHEVFFRLKHDLVKLNPPLLPEGFSFQLVDQENYEDLQDVVKIINQSYAHIRINLEQVQSWCQLPVFKFDLWVFVQDDLKQQRIALGIAELDLEVREGMLEWIQVLPNYRGRGIG